MCFKGNALFIRALGWCTLDICFCFSEWSKDSDIYFKSKVPQCFACALTIRKGSHIILWEVVEHAGLKPSMHMVHIGFLDFWDMQEKVFFLRKKDTFT